VEQAVIVKGILDRYEASTGQLVSLGKCSILYGEECKPEVHTAIQGILKYDTDCFEEKYLGLPVPEGRVKSGKFKSTKEKFSKHACDWSEKYMSSGAKEILIKSVLQAISAYAMGVFKFPIGLIDELTQIIRNFWWGMKRIDGKCIGCPGTRWLALSRRAALASEISEFLTRHSWHVKLGV
jgi:hypothetical protein